MTEFLEKTTANNSAHYNSVTDAWRVIFGDNFHWGFFEHSQIEWNNASTALIDKLASYGDFTSESSVLDVGCGVGGPAFYLYDKFNCSIIGISTSEKGVEEANNKSKIKGCHSRVIFELSDAMENGYPDNTFDIVWVMESAHLMPDKRKLFRENYRVLKKGGTMLLCDNMVRRKLNERELFKYYKELIVLKKVFGNMKHETIGQYIRLGKEAGFVRIESLDIGNETFPTTRHLKENVKNKYKELEILISKSEIDHFLLACDYVDELFHEGIATYGLMKAVKDE